MPGAGVGTVYLADGITVVTAGTSYTLAQIQGMRFLAAAGVRPEASVEQTTEDRHPRTFFLGHVPVD